MWLRHDWDWEGIFVNLRQSCDLELWLKKVSSSQIGLKSKTLKLLWLRTVT